GNEHENQQHCEKLQIHSFGHGSSLLWPRSAIPATTQATAIISPSVRRAFIRSSKWSPTRNTLAMIVSPGFTAPLEQKRLASTTERLSSSRALQLRSSALIFGSFPN